MVSKEMPDREKKQLDRIESKEWIESLDYVIKHREPERVKQLLRQLQHRAAEFGIILPYSITTPYINTIPRHEQRPFPGNLEIEGRLKSFIRWNAMAMVVRANRAEDGIGGHISTYASSATLYEVGFNHFFKGKDNENGGDMIYFQGHAAPGIYARAYMEGRLTKKHLENFRRELKPGGGLSSYPHPWLMPDFWEFPTVSMGLGPLMAIYQARFNCYLENRGLIKKSGKVWAFLGDGEMDEPESMGSITLASREKLDNLIFVINCNLQRLDGPVRGNGKIIQELESAFRGAGWNVIKVVWGGNWDPLLESDDRDVLVQRMEKAVDGDYQKYSVEPSSYIREHFFGTDERLRKMVERLSDDEILRLNRGGHDPIKIYNAYKAAVEHKGAPTVILAKTIKGYGLGESGEGKNITHQQKKLNEEELRAFRARFGIPISDEQIGEAPFYKPSDDTPEIKYLHECRKKQGGYLPARREKAEKLKLPPDQLFEEFDMGSNDRPAATTMVYVRILSKLLRDQNIGKHIVPIISDEARTFGMESLFQQYGIYSHVGQLYEPVDSDSLLSYKETRDGQVIQEGITEAGSLASFIAAGTSYATHGVHTIPFFTFYSMFGFQRIGDLIWAAGDMRCRGFLVGGTAGRTTLAGEGLQHQDGHSHVLAYTHPRIVAYDPAFAYELAAIMKEGLRRMYVEQEYLIYYITVGNEPYLMPPKPKEENVDSGILKGLYRFQVSELVDARGHVHLLGSGALMNEALKAKNILEKEYQVAADVWSVTSYKQLFIDALEIERWNMLHPDESPRQPYVTECLANHSGAVVAVSDYSKTLPSSIAKWIPLPLVCLGTDGLGRSEGRSSLRDFFEVDARYITLAALEKLVEQNSISSDVLKKAMQDLKIDADKPNPMTD